MWSGPCAYLCIICHFVGINSPSTLTSVPFLTNVAAEYRQKKLEFYLQVSAHNIFQDFYLKMVTDNNNHHHHLFAQSITVTTSNTARRQYGRTVRQHRVAVITACRKKLSRDYVNTALKATSNASILKKIHPVYLHLIIIIIII